MGLKFKVSAFSFFQTNISAVERLYKDALSLAPDFENMTVFDLFCGTGTITQALALKAKEVYGVEIVKEAVETARITAEENGFTNCHFIEGNVFKVLENLSKTPDLIVVDPRCYAIAQQHREQLQKCGDEARMLPGVPPVRPRRQGMSAALKDAAVLSWTLASKRKRLFRSVNYS